MLGVRDAFCDLCKYRSQEELFDLLAASVAEAQEDLVLAHTTTTRYESLRHTFGGDLGIGSTGRL